MERTMGDDSNAKLNFKSEGTLVQESDKTYWFPGTTGLKGVLVPSGHALDLVEGIVGRKLSADEFTLLFAMPLDGSKSVTIVSTLVSDPNEANYLKSLKHEVVGYIVSVRENAAKHNYGDTTGTDGFYDTNGKLQGLSTLHERKEPGLETPLLDPIDFVGGAVVDLAKAGVKVFGAAAARTLTRSTPVKTTLSKALRTITADEVELGSKQLAKRPPTVQEFRKFMATMTRGEEAVGERVGGRVSALEKGRARPFYHKDPKVPGKGPPGSAANRGFLDGSGRFHSYQGTGFPTVKDLANYSADELKALRQELQDSVRARIQQNIKFGMKPSEGERQAAEQALIRSIDKLLQ
jgi:hypothetical protein